MINVGKWATLFFIIILRLGLVAVRTNRKTIEGKYFSAFGLTRNDISKFSPPQMSMPSS